MTLYVSHGMAGPKSRLTRAVGIINKVHSLLFYVIFYNYIIVKTIIIQTKQKGLCSPELALEERRIEIRLTIYHFLTKLVQIIFMDALGLLDRISTKDHDYESLKASKLNWSE